MALAGEQDPDQADAKLLMLQVKPPQMLQQAPPQGSQMLDGMQPLNLV